MRNILLFCLYAIAVSSQDGNITCTVPPTELFQDAVLTCNYPEDLNATKKDFSVNYNPHDPIPDSVIDCWWLSGQMECSAKSGIMYQTHVNRTFIITFSNVTPAIAGIYACQVANYDPNLFQTCQLKVKTELEGKDKTRDQSFKTLVIALPVGLVVLAALVAAAIVFLLKYKGSRTAELGDEEGQPMVEKRKPDSVTKSFQEHLVKEISTMYPNFSKSFYFVPPVYFNRTRYRPQTVAGQLVYLPDPPDPSDVRHDRAMQHVIHCLRHVAESQKESMFVLTQFQYEDYLNSPHPAYLHHRLTTPAGLREADRDVGCFDFLIVHRLHGLLVGVVKAVSDRDAESQNNELRGRHLIVQEVAQAVHQLEKAKRMIQHLLSDQNISNIRQTLILPSLSSSSLWDAIGKHVNLVQNLRECLGANAVDDPTKLCLCAEQLSDSSRPWDVSQYVIKDMLDCWKWNDRSKHYATMAEELYLNIIARFFGPATLSSLRVPEDFEPFSLPKTLPEAVFLTGDLFERLVLSPDLINKPRVVLSGPPNSGKTKFLSLAGGQWLSSGHDVVVIKDKLSSNVSFLLLYLKELQSKYDNESASDSPFGSIYEDEWSFSSIKSIEQCIERILERKTGNVLCLLIDEASFDRERAKECCDALLKRVPGARWWMTCTSLNNSPELPYERRLTEVLPCPPSVLREVTNADANKSNTYPPHADGPPVKHIHQKQSGISPQDCQELGSEVGLFLVKSLLVVGKDKVGEKTLRDKVKVEDIMTVTLGNASAKHTIRKSLQFQDVLIVFEFNSDARLPNVEDDCKFLKGLKESGILVNTVTERNTDDLSDEDSDIALAVHVRHMDTWKSKRKIVVFVQSVSDSDYADRRQRVLLSCTSQLIWVHPSVELYTAIGS